ncbi:MAG: hypothetical protein CMJ83_22925 [Planctomycetes bacterium]|nr:hypothetical protein [Planctomycetota bacterium]
MSRCLPRWSRTIGTLAVLATVLAAQVQPNSAAAFLEVNGRAGAGYDGTMPILVAPNAMLDWDVQGPPGSAFAIGAGNALEPGLPTINGLINIDPASLVVVAVGVGDPFFSTNAAGQFMVSVTAPFAVGTELAVQIAIPVPGMPVLTAPTRMRWVPGDPLEQDFLVRFDPASFSAGNRHVAIGDVNGDGKPDLGNSAGIFLGDGAFGFSFVNIDPAGVEAGIVDIVGDANPDLVVLDEVFLGLKLFPGDGSGNFLGSTPIQLPVFCKDNGDVRFTDFDGDGDQDILIATGDTASPGLARFQNLGGDVFFLFGATFYDDAFCVEAADLNKDGEIDIVVGGLSFTTGLEETRILWGAPGAMHGLGNSTVITQTPEVGSRWIRAHDLNGDNAPDLVWAGVANQGVLLNDGSGGFTYGAAPAGPTAGFWEPRIDAADMDDDGDLDLVYVDRTATAGPYVVVSPNDGAGGFTDQWYLPIASATNALPAHAVPVDIDGDGDDDLVTGGTPATLIENQN